MRSFVFPDPELPSTRAFSALGGCFTQDQRMQCASLEQLTWGLVGHIAEAKVLVRCSACGATGEFLFGAFCVCLLGLAGFVGQGSQLCVSSTFF